VALARIPVGMHAAAAGSRARAEPGKAGQDALPVSGALTAGA
jgi:hypothetical protein